MKPIKYILTLLVTLSFLQSCACVGGSHCYRGDKPSAGPVDTVSKFPEISDDSLLTLVQKRTFRYFWDYAHPVSGLVRERLGSGDIVTSGGSGFGVMAIPVAIERGFITREEGAARVLKILTFLNTKADRFHGAFSHWMNGSTGKVIPFSTFDDGGDIVETALLLQGLLTVRQYFNSSDPVDGAIRDIIEQIWETVEWDWYTRGENVLYWHWSLDFGWEMDMQVNGWNEALIAYVLAASSPTYPISKDVYDEGWARRGEMANGKKFYGIRLPLGPDYGGPLFFAHYSFLGLDPRMVSDKYADYAAEVVREFKNRGIMKVEADYRTEKIGYKIREARMERVPYILVVGAEEMENKTVSVRSRQKGDEGSQSLESFVNRVDEEIKTKFNYLQHIEVQEESK